MGFSDEREYDFAIERFTGIDQGMEGNDTPMHCSRNAENCDTSGGVLRLSTGWAPDTTVNSAPDNIRSLMEFHKKNTDGSISTILMAATDNNIFKYENDMWISINDPDAPLPISSGRFSYITYQKEDKSIFIMANGTDTVYSWNGTDKLAKLAVDAPFLTGFPDADKESNLIRLTNHGLKAGDAVAFYPEKGKLPSKLAALDTYFVKSAYADTVTVGTSMKSNTTTDIKTLGTKGWRMAKVQWLGGTAVPTAHDNSCNITLTGHGLEQNDKVVFDPWNGSLPSNIAPNRVYYAGLVDANTFYITTSPDDPDDKVISNSDATNFKVRKNIQSNWVTGAPSASTKSDIFTFTGHGLADKTAVEFICDAGGSTPSGIIAHDGTETGKFYYVVKATPNTFKVSDSVGGAPINLNSAGLKFKVRLSRENRPAGGSLALHAERVWCAGEKTRPNSAFFSDDMNPSNWAIGTDAAGEINKPTWDGDAVTAVANLFDSIVVFKGKSMFRIAGSTPGDYQITSILSTTGTLSPFTICQWQNAAFFLSPAGIMAFDGMKCDRLGGNALKDFWFRLNTSSAALAGACAVVYDGRLLTALPVDGSDINNCVVEFDIAAGTYMVRTGIQVDAWLPGEELRFASGKNVNIWGRAIEGFKVYGTAENRAISMRWETPESDFGGRNAIKTVTAVAVTGSGKALGNAYQGGKLGITVKADGKTCEKTVTLPASTGTVKASFYISGRLISIALANVEGSNIEVSGVTVMYEREDD